MLKKTIACKALVALLTFASAAIWAADPTYIGTVSPTGERLAFSIAVPTVKAGAGSGTLSAEEPMHTIIYRDLTISGFFVPVKDQGFVEEAAAGDQRTGQVRFEEWTRIGAQFLALCEYQLSGGSLGGTCRLVSIQDGREVMAKQYKGYRQADYRRLAHRMSDDIVQAVSHARGIAGTQIVYISRRGQNKEVYITDPDGAGQRPLTRDNNLNATPAWGANATEVYYTSFKDYNPDLCGVFVSRPDTWFISRRQGFNLSPDYNFSSKRIALALGKDGNHEVYTMDRVGKNTKRLTYNIAIDGSPSWNPSGSQIVFSSDRAHSGRPDIYVMEADGSNQRRLTTQNYYNDTADWSPLGDKIVFVSQASRGDDFNIYTMNVDGSNWKRLTSGQSNNEDPSWAPDGEHIVFSSNRSGSYQLYIMNADGTNVHQVTRSGENYSPDWSPYFP